MTVATLPTPATMYRALVRKDSSYEGVFGVGVRTTGIFCRPTCTARKPLRQNVEFFPRVTDALTSGYRPCKRCQLIETGAYGWHHPDPPRNGAGSNVRQSIPILWKEGLPINSASI